MPSTKTTEISDNHQVLHSSERRCGRTRSAMKKEEEHISTAEAQAEERSPSKARGLNASSDWKAESDRSSRIGLGLGSPKNRHKTPTTLRGFDELSEAQGDIRFPYEMRNILLRGPQGPPSRSETQSNDPPSIPSSSRKRCQSPVTSTASRERQLRSTFSSQIVDKDEGEPTQVSTYIPSPRKKKMGRISPRSVFEHGGYAAAGHLNRANFFQLPLHMETASSVRSSARVEIPLENCVRFPATGILNAATEPKMPDQEEATWNALFKWARNSRPIQRELEKWAKIAPQSPPPEHASLDDVMFNKCLDGVFLDDNEDWQLEDIICDRDLDEAFLDNNPYTIRPLDSSPRSGRRPPLKLGFEFPEGKELNNNLYGLLFGSRGPTPEDPLNPSRFHNFKSKLTKLSAIPGSQAALRSFQYHNMKLEGLQSLLVNLDYLIKDPYPLICTTNRIDYSMEDIISPVLGRREGFQLAALGSPHSLLSKWNQLCSLELISDIAEQRFKCQEVMGLSGCISRTDVELSGLVWWEIERASWPLRRFLEQRLDESEARKGMEQVVYSETVSDGDEWYNFYVGLDRCVTSGVVEDEMWERGLDLS